MAKYKSQFFEQSNMTTAALGAFLTSAGWEFTTSGDTITIELSNKVSLVIARGVSGYPYFDFSAVINGVSTSAKRIYRNTTLLSCKSSGVALLEAFGGYDSLRFGFLYEKIGDRELYGIYNTNGATYVPITDYGLTDVDTSVVYTHGALLNYTAESGTIDFANNDCLFLSGVKSINDANFKACSTMTVNTVITVQGKNCFVAAPHSFFEFDS